MLRMLCLLCCFCCAVLVYAEAVTGVVLSPKGEPIPNARLAIRAPLTDEYIVRQTDAAGAFTVDLPPPREAATPFGWCTIYAEDYALTSYTFTAAAPNTITLSTPGTAAGRVVDAQGKPVPGTTVRASYVRGPRQDWGIFIPPPFQPFYTVTTDEAGTWRIQDLPSAGTVTIDLDDPRFVRVRSNVRIGGDQATQDAIIARPDARIAGAVRTPDGKPAAGITVYAKQRYEWYAEAETDADGRYALTGMPAGLSSMGVRDATGAWVAAPVKDILLTEGQITAAPDITLSEGVLIRGRMTDGATGKPLESIQLNCRETAKEDDEFGWTYGKSDTEGRYQLRVMPGTYEIRPSWHAPTGYVMPEAVTVTATKVGEQRTVDFALSTGLSISGTVVDGEKKPASGVRLEIRLLCGNCGIEGCWHDRGIPFQSDADGRFTVSGLTRGEALVVLPTETHGFAGMSEWDVVSPTRIKLPINGPLRITVRKVELQTFVGRVVSTTGAPIPGAEVSVEIAIPHGSWGGSSFTRQMVTGADGRFAIDPVRPDTTVSVKSVEKPGYRMQLLGAAKRVRELPIITDTVMASLGARVSGMVVDANGNPVSKAQVIAPEVGATPRAETDAQGRFTLTGIPEGAAGLLAVGTAGAGWWRGDSRDPGDVTISLRPAVQVAPVDIERVVALLAEDAAQRREKRDAILAALARVDCDRALALAQENGAALSDKLRMDMIRILAQSDPERAAAWAPEQMRTLTKPDMRYRAAYHLGLAVVTTHPQLARECCEIARAAIERMPRDDARYHAVYLLRLALQLPDASAQTLLTDALTIARADKEGEHLFAFIAVEVTLANPALGKQILDGLGGRARYDALGMLIEELCKVDPAEALKWLPDFLAAHHGVPYSRPGTVLALIEALGATDPAAALRLAEEADEFQRSAALALVARRMPKEDALALYRKASMLVRPMALEAVRTKSRIAAEAYALDQEIGTALFADARTFAGSEHLNPNDGNPLPRFLYYYSRIEPVESRLLLEADYARAKQHATRDAEWALRPYPLAMAPLDIERALEMAREITARTPREFGDMPYMDILNYIIADDDARLKETFRDY